MTQCTTVSLPWSHANKSLQARLQLARLICLVRINTRGVARWSRENEAAACRHQNGRNRQQHFCYLHQDFIILPFQAIFNNFNSQTEHSAWPNGRLSGRLDRNGISGIRRLTMNQNAAQIEGPFNATVLSMKYDAFTQVKADMLTICEKWQGCHCGALV